MTSKLSKLVSDAREAGMEVVQDNGHTTIVAKRHRGTGKVLKGLKLYEDGTGINLAVRPDLAVGLRSVADMRKVLGLEKK